MMLPVARILSRLPVLGLLLLAACSQDAPPADHAHAGISISDAWVNQPPPGATVAGAYLTLHNHGAQDRLIAIQSPASERVEIHEMKTASGMMQMRELKDGLPLPAGDSVALAPGGVHLMLIAPTRELVIGDSVEMHLTFAHARAQTVVFDVRSRMDGEDPRAHQGHHGRH